MDAFATFADLSLRLQRDFAPSEQGWVTALLEDAADYMRGVIGNQVYPPAQSTYIAYPTGGWVNLPQSPVQSVDSVERDGLDVKFERFQDSIKVDCREPVTVTFSYGVAVVPSDLRSFNCALAAQMMLTVESGLGLTAGGLSSVAIDDFKASFADAGASTGMYLTDASQTYLRNKYGTTAWVVGVGR